MKKAATFLTAIFFVILSISNFAFSQGKVYDDFSLKAMPNWVWGGVEMKYSHNEDNKENGFAEIFTTKVIKPNSYIGNVSKNSPFLITAGNYVNVMLKGVDNDVTVKLSLIYDVDNNNMYNDSEDILLETDAISLDFNGWKELKVKIDQENFKLISKHEDDFTVTEEAAMGIKIDFMAGPKYKESKFESGIALVSEIENRENLTEKFSNLKREKESYFQAKNYPNPFNPTTLISFTLQEATNVSVTVYDRLGREVKILMDENKPAGSYSVEFNADGLPSGIYFYRIKTSDRTEVMKMILAK
jgi:hypothetical protein